VDRCSADPFQLRRIQVLDDPLWRFAFRLLEAQAPSRLARWVLGPSHIPADGDGV
jgi:hypothetical protein